LRPLLWGLLALSLFVGKVCADPSALEMTQANVQFNLALNFYKAQKYDDAADTLKKALDVVPDHPQANLLLGLIRSQKADYKGAIAPLEIATKALPDNFDASYYLGIAAYQTKDFLTAESAFEHAASLNPGRTDVLINLGVLEISQKKWKEAQDAFGKAAAADPKDLKAYEGIAEAAGQDGDKAAEIDALGKSLALSDDDVVRLNLAEKEYENEQIDEAMKTLEPLQGKGNSQAEFLLGCMLYRKARFDDSRSRFEEALKDRPDYPEARFNLAITLYDQNKFSDALAQFNEVLKDHPDDSQAKNNLEITRRAAVRSFLKAGSEDFLQGDYLAAMDHWRQALELENDNKVIKDLLDTAQTQLKLQAAELAGKGDLAFQKGDMEEAVGDWGQALERDPDNTEAKAGMDKMKPEVDKLSEIYSNSFQSQMLQEDLVQAGETAQKLQTINKSKGSDALAQWKAKVDATVTQLGLDSDAAAQKGDLLGAEEKLEEAQRYRKDDNALALRLDQAKVALRTAIEKGMAQAKEEVSAKENEKALADYRYVLGLDPVNGEAKNEAARLAKLLKSKAADPAQLDDWYYQGVYAYAAGDTNKAMSFWKKVLEADPDNRQANEAVNRANRRIKALSTVN
jgi:tetratricopeptide (TPR) repeat protein